MATAVSDSITPLVLAYNEQENIGRTLKALSWAKRVVVVDSVSTDATRAIAESFANVAFFARPFTCHKDQWSFGVYDTGIATDYVLALDADMQVTPAMVAELEARFLGRGFAGGMVPIAWCYFGKALLRSFCPPQLRLFNKALVKISQPGHTQEFETPAPILPLRHGVLHEDRKGIERWIRSQLSYSRLEEERLRAGVKMRWRDRVRRAGWMPALSGLLSYVRAGGPFGGKRAIRYAWERTTYECLLAIRCLDDELAAEETRATGGQVQSPAPEQ